MLRSIRRSMVLALAMGGVCGSAMAETWDSGGADSNWGTALNWDTNLVPANNGTANLFFGSGAKLAPVVNVPFDVNSITFSSGSAAFSLSGSPLTIRGGGITVNSANSQAFFNAMVVGAPQTWTAGAGPLQAFGPINNAGLLTIAGSSTTTFQGAVSGSAGITKTGAGQFILGGGPPDTTPNTFTGLVTLSAGTLTLDKATGIAALGGDMTVNGSGTLVLNRAGQFSPTSNLTFGGGGGVFLGPSANLGTFTITSASGASGSMVLNSSAQYAYNIGAGLGLPFGVTLAGASGGGINLLQNGALVTTQIGPIDLGNRSRAINVPDNLFGDDLVISGVISNGAVVKTGPGEVGLLGANTYTGGTTISAGYVHIAADNGLGPAGTPVTSSAFIETSSTFVFSHSLTSTGAGGFIPAAGTTLTLGGPVSGTVLGKLGAGTLVLPTATSLTSYSSLTAGTLALGNDGSLGQTLLSMYGGSLRADGGPRTIANSINIYYENSPIGFEGSDLTVNGSISLINANHVLTVNNKTTFAGPIGESGAGSGFTKEGTGTLVLSGNNTLNGTINIKRGALEMAGGILNGPVSNNATFVYTAGAFNSYLDNYGQVVFNNLNFTSSGLSNFGTMNLPAGMTLTSNSWFINQASMTFTNATFNGNAPFLNYGTMSGSGEVTGARQFLNAGQLTSSGSLNLTDLSPEGFLANTGEIDVPAASQLFLFGSPLKNTGVLNMSGGGLNSGNGGALNNEIGGTITGHGNIYADMGNSAGSVVVSSGTLNILKGFANSGAIQLGGLAATLSGGAIVNTGTIQGFGTVANQVVNSSGSVEALGGTLILAATGSTNGGLIAASGGNKLLMTKGLATNAGTISLTGGTFDNGNNPMSNTGQISGYGTFRSGGLTNNGSITLTGGVTTVNGNVTNAATKRVEVRYTPAIFTGTFTNNGIFKNTSAQVTFSGTYIENGSFLSDPADNYFADALIGAGGAWSGGVGDRFIISGDLINGSSAKDAWQTAAAELRFAGGGIHTYSAAGIDLGISYQGYEDNFAWGRLVLAAGESLKIESDAVYVRTLELAGGLAQIGSITSDGNIYYDLGEPANAYLGGKTYQLSGGGMIAAVPEPGFAAVMILGLGLMARRRQRISCM